MSLCKLVESRLYTINPVPLEAIRVSMDIQWSLLIRLKDPDITIKMAYALDLA